ncbi:MAG TPA: VOC family protein [Spirochaetota bacterium]|nr:VOC family protein [Spirochaetota bacterium]HPJ33951.1 VOC family protein [Spirochaetota bacterium]
MIVIESVNHIGITVSDLENSIRFYKDLFDFDVIENISNSGQAFLKMGDIFISLIEVKGYVNSEDSRSCISFYVDEEDFQDALDEIGEMELQIILGPENIRKGERVVFADPDGNLIELSYPKID